MNKFPDVYIGIFMGEGEYDELHDLERRRKAEGWTFGSFDDMNVQIRLAKNPELPVVINGGSAFECVAYMVGKALESGVPCVIVPLNEIIQRESGVVTEVEQMRLNASSLASGIRSKYRTNHLKDARLHVEPKEIWEEECLRIYNR